MKNNEIGISQIREPIDLLSKILIRFSLKSNINKKVIKIYDANLFKNYNFYSKYHPYFDDFEIKNKNLSSYMPYFKKRYRFFYFDRPETNFFDRKNYQP